MSSSTAVGGSTTTKRKVVLITGATGGIGRATAIAFSKTGEYDLALHYHSASEEVRNEILQEMDAASSKGKPVEVDFFQADLSNFDSVRSLHESVTDRFNAVDVLFNNAGSTCGYSGVQNLAEVPMDVFEETWRVNTGSAILLTQSCLPEMEAKGWGRVVFCSSVAAFTGGFVGPHYASSKSGGHGVVHWYRPQLSLVALHM
jgi:3-oxoacyl-[acyl-carrier protein] reductase